MRCYLKYKDGAEDYSAARSFSGVPSTLSEPLPEKIKVRFIDANDEVTGIGSVNTQTGEVSFDSKTWYTLDGVRLNAQPTQKGIYIVNGQKCYVK
jgi:protoporphyrinogen oxidase